MPTIKITPNEYADITIAFLLDSIIKKDEILTDHDDFKHVMKKLEGSGMKTHFLHMYLNMDTKTRSKYKIIRKAFTKEGSGGYNIHIIDEKKKKPISEPNKTSKTKDLIKKAIKMIKSHKMRYGRLITEETVDKIIDKVMKDE